MEIKGDNINKRRRYATVFSVKQCNQALKKKMKKMKKVVDKRQKM